MKSVTMTTAVQVSTLDIPRPGTRMIAGVERLWKRGRGEDLVRMRLKLGYGLRRVSRNSGSDKVKLILVCDDGGYSELRSFEARSMLFGGGWRCGLHLRSFALRGYAGSLFHIFLNTVLLLYCCSLTFLTSLPPPSCRVLGAIFLCERGFRHFVIQD